MTDNHNTTTNVIPTAPTLPNALTPDGAAAKLAELSADKSWVKKVFDRDVTALGEFNNLTAIKATADTRFEDALAGKPAPAMEVTSEENPLSSREIAAGIEHLRANGITSAEGLRHAVLGKTVTKAEHESAQFAMKALQGNKNWREAFMRGEPLQKRDFFILTTVISSDIAE